MTQPKLATARSGWGGRGYYIPGHKDENDRRMIYPSVTTILSQVAKPALHQWIADQTAAAAVVSLPRLQMHSEEVGWGMLRFVWSRKPDLGDPIREYYKGVRDDAAELGTNLHEWMEADIDGLMPYPDLASDEAEQMVEQYLIWRQTHDVISHHSEFTVLNQKIGYAGTADADWSILCLHEGTPCLGQAPGEWARSLIDFKSSRFTWREHGMQLGLLGMADTMMVEVPEGFEGALKHEATQDGVKMKSWWIEEPAPEYSCYALLHIRPNDLDTNGNDIPAFCILKDMTPKIEIYKRGALGAFELAKSQHEEKAWDKLHGVKETEDDEDGF